MRSVGPTGMHVCIAIMLSSPSVTWGLSHAAHTHTAYTIKLRLAHFSVGESESVRISHIGPCASDFHHECIGSWNFINSTESKQGDKTK